MKNFKFLSVLFLALSLIGACKVSKDIEMPKPDLPVAFRNAAEYDDTSSIGSVPWKALFAQEELRRLIDSALAKNFNLKIAIKNIEISQLQFKQVKWNNVPVADLNITAGSQRPSDNSITGLSLNAFKVGTNHIEDYSANLSISWEADIWGKIRSEQKGALATYLQTGEAKKVIQTSIVAAVATGYYNLLMLDDQLEIAKKNEILDNSTLRIIKLQYESGQVSSLAVQQAEAQRLSAAQLVPQFERNIELQENALRILSGELPDKIERNIALNQVVVPESITVGYPSAILSRRPDVKGAELALMNANGKVGIAKAEMYPALRISASGGVNSFKASNWFNIPGSLFGVASGSVIQPLFDHKQLKTNYEVAKVEREKTVLQFRQSVLNAVGEVSDAIVKIQKLRLEQTIAAHRVHTFQKATDNAKLLFQNGMATYLEVITAQGNVLQSELELSSVNRDLLSAVTELYRSLGGGWK